MTIEPKCAYDLFGWYRAALDPRRGDKAMEARITRCYHELIHNWTAPDRFYHTLVNHLQPLVLSIVGGNPSSLGYDRRALILAAFYHDARMDFSKPDSANVSDSVAFWNDHHRFIHQDALDVPGVVSGFASDVAKLILSTDYSRPIDPSYVALRNRDLATLAGSWEDYQRNGELILEEKKRRSCGAAVWTALTQQAYLLDQMSWLSGLLRSQRIFFLDDDDETELKARANLGRHLAEVIQALQPLRSDRV